MSGARTAEEENLRIVKSSIEAYNSHDVSRAIEYEGPSVVQYSPASLKGVIGRESVISSMTADFVAFPDIHFKVERIIGQGDWVSVQGVMTGTNTGPMMTEKGRTVKASKRRMSIPQAYFHRLQDGKIVETHGYWDIRYPTAQLGFLRKNVMRLLLFMAIGLGFMVVQGTILHSPDTLSQLLYMLVAPLPVIFGAVWLGRTLLAFGRIN